MNKAIGYTLLVIGLLMIIIPLYMTYGAISGNFKIPQIIQKVSIGQPSQVGQFDVQGQLQNAVAKAIPTDSINQVINLIAWVILILVFIFGGKQIAQIGVGLLKV